MVAVDPADLLPDFAAPVRQHAPDLGQLVHRLSTLNSILTVEPYLRAPFASVIAAVRPSFGLNFGLLNLK